VSATGNPLVQNPTFLLKWLNLVYIASLQPLDTQSGATPGPGRRSGIVQENAGLGRRVQGFRRGRGRTRRGFKKWCRGSKKVDSRVPQETAGMPKSGRPGPGNARGSCRKTRVQESGFRVYSGDWVDPGGDSEKWARGSENVDTRTTPRNHGDATTKTNVTTLNHLGAPVPPPSSA